MGDSEENRRQKLSITLHPVSKRGQKWSNEKVKVAKCLQHVHVMPRRLGVDIKIHVDHKSTECSGVCSGVYSFLLHPNFSKTEKSVI